MVGCVQKYESLNGKWINNKNHSIIVLREVHPDRYAINIESDSKGVLRDSLNDCHSLFLYSAADRSLQCSSESEMSVVMYYDVKADSLYNGVIGSYHREFCIFCQ